MEFLGHKKGILALVLIVLLGAGLRLWGLDIQSFWNDELSSLHRGSPNNIADVINATAQIDIHPPGYNLFIHYWQKLGNSEVMIRLPSAICGIISIAVIFILGSRLFSWKEGLVASVLTAFLKCPIFYSQEARSYSMLLLFSMLTVYFWLLIIECMQKNEKIKVSIWAGYFMSALICCYLHYFGLYFVFVQGVSTLILCCRSRKAVISWSIIYAAILLAYLPWISVVLKHLHKKAGYIHSPGNIIEWWNGYLKFLFNNSQSFVLIVVMSFLYLLALYIFKIRQNKRMQELLLLGWLIIPFLGVYLVSQFTTLHVLNNRNLIIVLPAVYLLFARAVIQLPMSFRMKIAGMVLLTIIVLNQLFFEIKYYSTPQKEQFREAVDYVVRKDVQLKGPIVVGSVWSSKYLDYYFQKKKSDQRVKYNLHYSSDNKQATAIVSLQKDEPEYLWYIHLNHPRDKQFIDLLNMKMRLVEYQKLIGGGIYLFQRKGFDRNDQ